VIAVPIAIAGCHPRGGELVFVCVRVAGLAWSLCPACNCSSSSTCPQSAAAVCRRGCVGTRRSSVVQAPTAEHPFRRRSASFSAAGIAFRRRHAHPRSYVLPSVLPGTQILGGYITLHLSYVEWPKVKNC